MSRSFGGKWLTTRSPMRISPPVMFSRPAIIRSKVDLPQPDGPTSTTNSPSRIEISTPWMTAVAPKAFRTSRIATEAIHSSQAAAAALRIIFSVFSTARPDAPPEHPQSNHPAFGLRKASPTYGLVGVSGGADPALQRHAAVDQVW